MPRGSVPDHLKHRPEEVKRNAERFDRLCELAEEISFPIVREALIEETKTPSAEALTQEAKLALEALLNDARLLDEPEDQETLDKLREGLSDMTRLPVDEEECQSHTRDVAQVLTGTWVELLRQDLLKFEILRLSEQLLPTAECDPMFGHLFYKSYTEKSPTLRALVDALAPLALNEKRILKLLSTLREVLFDQPCSVDLPFDIALAGGPEKPIFAMKKDFYDRISTERANNFTSSKITLGAWKSPIKPQSASSKLTTAPKSKSVVNLQNPLSESDFAALTAAASRYLPGANASAEEAAELLTYKT